MKTPPGYVTAARAEHLTESFMDGVRAILDQYVARAAERCAPESDPKKVRAILDEEGRRARRELELLQARHHEQIMASDH